MTVKELIKILEICNPKATVRIKVDGKFDEIHESQIWQTTETEFVYLDADEGIE